MLTLFLLLAVAGGVVRLELQWGVQRRWGITIGIPQALAGALVVLAGLPEFLRPFPSRYRSTSPSACSCQTFWCGGAEMQTLRIRAGDLVIIEGFDDIPEHHFQVEEVYKDLVTGTVLTGPLAGEDGEPEIEMIVEVIAQGTLNDS